MAVVAFFIREALKGVLGGLEDWLYSEEADDADLAELKKKRRQASVLTTVSHAIRFIALTLPMETVALLIPDSFGITLFGRCHRWQRSTLHARRMLSVWARPSGQESCWCLLLCRVMREKRLLTFSPACPFCRFVLGGQVDSELKDNVAKAYFSAVEADRMKVSDTKIPTNLKAKPGVGVLPRTKQYRHSRSIVRFITTLFSPSSSQKLAATIETKPLMILTAATSLHTGLFQ